MKTIVLHGALGEKFGREWKLKVSSPAEALRAIQANRPGFAAHIAESGQAGVGYRVIVGERDTKAEDLGAPYGKEVLHIVPVIGGAKKGGLGMIVLGAALIAVTMGSATPFVAGASSGFGAMSIASIGLNVGMGLVLGGVAQMLVKTPETPKGVESQDTKPSYYFNGPVNTGGQGSGVPVGYGRLVVGSILISGGLSSENLI